MFSATRIAGIGMYVPSNKMENRDVVDILRTRSLPYLGEETMEEVVTEVHDKLKRVGSETRYWCDANEYCTDIAYHASREAIEDAGIDTDEIDLVMYTGMSKAFVEPATGHVLHHRLKTKNANVMDTQDACTSFIKTMELADALIKNGTYKKILIASGERSFDWADFTCKTRDELKWKFASLTIGDAAGAIVLEGTNEPDYAEDPKHFKLFHRIYSEALPSCTIGLNHNIGERYRLFSHSKKLIQNGYRATDDLIGHIYSLDEWTDFTYDMLLCHNVGNAVDGYIKEILERNNAWVPGSYKPFFPEYGNVASASVPLELCLARQEGRLKRHDMVLTIVPAAGVQCGVMTFRY